jgi:hypothetical protein
MLLPSHYETVHSSSRSVPYVHDEFQIYFTVTIFIPFQACYSIGYKAGVLNNFMPSMPDEVKEKSGTP